MNYREFTKSELRWVKSFERVMKKAPETLFFFVGSGQTIFTKDENNLRYMSKWGGVDQAANGIGIETPLECDGGDY